MKYLLLIFPVFIFVFLACDAKEKEARWEIKKENPVYGLTLSYLLPLDQIQKIVGNKAIPAINDEGMGSLNLTIMSGNQYYIDGENYGDMQEAHLLIRTEGSVTVPRSMGVKGQKLNDVFGEYNFNRILGDINLNVEEKNDSLSIKALLLTTDGSISMSAKALNKPGELKSIDSVKVTSSENPNYYFIGSESSRRIQIDSILISESGENWISNWNLPAQPNTISMSIYSTWDFTFREELLPDPTQNKDSQ